MPQNFLEDCLTAPLVGFRTYSRRTANGRESWAEICKRTLSGLVKTGNLTETQIELIDKMQQDFKVLTSGRWLWIGGTEWLDDPINVYGAYNCSHTTIRTLHDIAMQMELTMVGCGIGKGLELKDISQLPPVVHALDLNVSPLSVLYNKGERLDNTGISITRSNNTATIVVGDSRQGWVDAYQKLLELSTGHYDLKTDKAVKVKIDLSYIRPHGTPIKGFGGVANADSLPRMFYQVAKVLNRAVGRQMTAEEVCLIIDEALVCVVSGNVRRSASIALFDYDSPLLKENLWQQDSDTGKWSIDPDRDALRMGNHTRVYHTKPTEEQCIDAVRSQFYSGEGAIEWAGESVARANADLLDTPELKSELIRLYEKDKRQARLFLADLDGTLDDKELDHRMIRYGLNPCGEIIMTNNFCNLGEVHLNMLDPFDLGEQEDAFRASGYAVAVLLHHNFPNENYQYSRDIDPIVGVSFTGLFDFFVKRFGTDWLKWWEAGRPSQWGDISGQLFEGADSEEFKWLSDYFKFKEMEYLSFWKDTATRAVYEYCDANGLRRPNRCTTCQPAGSKSLLTGASAGWHPPISARYIRRITFRKNDPVALAAIDYGYSVIPSQSCKDENGNLLDDAFDPRVTEWLVEVPIETSWANLDGADAIDISKFSALAQFDFYMQVQKFYTSHNCFARSTRFLTDKGIKDFFEFESGDVVNVLNKDGEWVPSTVVRTGDKRLMREIVIREGRSGRTKTITSTLCHRFPVKKIAAGNSPSTIVEAKDLKIGHRLVLNSMDFDLIELDSIGIQHGICFGDGALYKSKKGVPLGCQLYLCGAKRMLASYFDKYNIIDRDDINQCRIYKLPVRFKSLPDNNCTQAYLAGFILTGEINPTKKQPLPNR